MRNTKILYLYALAGLIATNVTMCFTERLPWLQDLTSCVLMLSVYALLLTAPRKLGTAIWWSFPFIFLNAFNIVLIDLFGRGAIAVDMFLNLITTNPSEASEVLQNLLPSLTIILILYIPLLVWASLANKKGLEFTREDRRFFQKTAISGLCVSAVLLGCCHISDKTYREVDNAFPVNAAYNMWLAIERTYQTENYAKTSSEFTFNATSSHPKDAKEVYVLVIGETARAMDFGLNGYARQTTPRLAAREGVISFTKAYSQSNTTHKSVPMLLSEVSAEDFGDIIHQKSLITAFKEAGFSTLFLSCQKHNRSYIEFFAHEADECVYLHDDSGFGKLSDFDCIPLLQKALEKAPQKLLVVIHAYGSHFNYRERYEKEDALFQPDLPSEARPENVSSLLNAYDNTIVMTDRLLDEVISALEGTGAIAGMLYVSDHGENVYDDYRQKFLHASPIPSWYEMHVPFIVWLSKGYDESFPEALDALTSHREAVVQTSESVFHTMLDLAGVRASLIDTTLSVASPSYTLRQRLYLTDRNEARPYDRIGLDEVDLENLDL